MGQPTQQRGPGTIWSSRWVPAALIGQTIASVVLVATLGKDHPAVMIGLTAVALISLVALLSRTRIDRHQHAPGPRGHLDPLTGVLDRGDLLIELRSDLLRNQAHAVLFVDLDGFKWINNSYGHEAGDRVLRDVADRMSRSARPEDIIARTGGDEFAIVLKGLSDARTALEIAERLLASIDEPVRTPEGGEVFPRASIGIAMAHLGATADGVLLDAHSAMSAAKSAGGNQVTVFNETMRAATTRRTQIDQALHKAVRGDAGTRPVSLVFQPITATDSGEITGFEALARWHDPTLGTVAPDEFITVAETSGLIHELGASLLAQSLDEAAWWPARSNGQPYTLSINVSWLQLSRGGLPGLLAQQLNRTGVAPSSVCVELTETALNDSIEQVTTALLLLRAMGVRVSIDDFGTGHASLRFLTELPIDEVKIDRLFTAKVDTDPGARAVVAGVVAMAQARGLSVVAEGVESRSQLATLVELAVPMAQGWLISRALPAGQVRSLVGAGPRAQSSASTVLHPVVPLQRGERPEHPVS